MNINNFGYKGDAGNSDSPNIASYKSVIPAVDIAAEDNYFEEIHDKLTVGTMIFVLTDNFNNLGICVVTSLDNGIVSVNGFQIS